MSNALSVFQDVPRLRSGVDSRFDFLCDGVPFRTNLIPSSWNSAESDDLLSESNSSSAGQTIQTGFCFDMQSMAATYRSAYCTAVSTEAGGSTNILCFNVMSVMPFTKCFLTNDSC